MLSKLHDLIDLAKEPSSERRRELLREVTNLFFSAESAPAPNELSLFDDVLSQLAADMEEEVRSELASRMADAATPPRRLILGLASDDAVAVARPLLTRSAALTEDDLLIVARTKGQDHLRAISGRAFVSEAVSDAIVKRADDDTLGVLLSNENANLSREAHQTATERAAANPALHGVVVDRQSLPPDLLNDLYFMVEARLRDRILERNASLDPAELDEALAASRNRIASRDGVLPPDFAISEGAVRALRAKGPLEPATLAGFLRNGETTKFLVALSLAADIDFHSAERILEKRELDALAIVCKVANFDRALFLTLAILILGPEADAMGRAREYGQLYAALPLEVASRTIRFWRMRRQTGDMAA